MPSLEHGRVRRAQTCAPGSDLLSVEHGRPVQQGSAHWARLASLAGAAVALPYLRLSAASGQLLFPRRGVHHIRVRLGLGGRLLRGFLRHWFILRMVSHFIHRFQVGARLLCFVFCPWRLATCRPMVVKYCPSPRRASPTHSCCSATLQNLRSAPRRESCWC